MRASDLATGLAFAALGLAVALLAQDFREPAGAASPRLFPTLIGGVMAALGIAVAGRDLRRRGLAVPVRREPWMRDRRLAVALSIPLAIATFGLVAPRFGTVATSTAIVAAVAVLWGAGPLRALVVGAVFSLALYLFFARVMSVPLPRGPVEGLLG